MQSQENNTPLEDMELYFSVPLDGVAEENGMMQIASAIRALVYETRETNIYLQSIDENMREVGIAAVVYRNIT